MGTRNKRIAYFVLLAAIFLGAAAKRFAGLPLAPFADKDLGGYISPVLSEFLGRGFILSNGRGFVYPAFVWFILRIGGGDFRVVAILQHVMGLLTGGLLLFAWIRARRFVVRPAVPSWVHSGMGLGLAAIYLFFNWPIVYEHRIRPEAVFPFFAALSVAGNCVLLTRREERTPFFLGVVLIFDAVLLYMLKPAWGFSVVFCCLPVGYSLVVARESLLRKLLIAMVSVGLSAGLLLYPEKVLERTDSSSGVFLPKLLFAMHANLIHDQMLSDVANHADVPYDRAWLAATAASLSVEIEKSKPGRRTLGFDPDYLIYEHSICDEITRHFEGHPDELAGFFKYYYVRTALRKPFAMTKKVLVQIGVFYSFSSSMYRTGPINVAEEYKKSLEILNGNLNYSPLIRGWSSLCSQATGARQLRNAPVMILVIHIIRFLHVFLLAGALVLCAFAMKGRLLLLALLDLLIYSYSFGNNLTVAVVHTLEVNRYVQNEFSFVLFLHFITILLLLEMWLGKKEAR